CYLTNSSHFHVPPFLSFFFNATAPAAIYTLSLHDALPIYSGPPPGGASSCSHCATKPCTADMRMAAFVGPEIAPGGRSIMLPDLDRKSTRLNSSHRTISYAVFCLKKKKQSILAYSTR